MNQEHFITMEMVAATLVHEVKNPLSLLEANVDYMALCDEEKKYKKNYDSMKVEIRKAAELLTQFIHLFQAMEQDGETDTEKTNLAELIDQAARDYEEIPGKNIAVLKNFGAYPLYFRGGKRLFGLMLSNVFKNAAEAIPSEGRIEISASSEHGQISLTIADDGCGIPAERLAQLNAGVSVTSKVYGTGLGTKICRCALAECGGTYRLESEEGKGTTVHITIPEWV